MKYNIVINQEVLSKYDVDLSDGALLDYLYHFCTSPSEAIEARRKRDEDGSIWTWIDYKTVLEEMPLLRAKEKSVISRRFRHLAKVLISQEPHAIGFIRLRTENQRIYVKLMPIMHTLFFKEGTVAPKQRSSKASVPEPSKATVAQKQQLSEGNAPLSESNSAVASKQPDRSPKATEHTTNNLSQDQFHEQQQSIAELLSYFKIFEEADRKYILKGRPPERVLEVLEMCKQKEHGIKEPVAWIKDALQRNYTWDSWKKEKQKQNRQRERAKVEEERQQALEREQRAAAVTQWITNNMVEYCVILRDKKEEAPESVKRTSERGLLTWAVAAAANEVWTRIQEEKTKQPVQQEFFGEQPWPAGKTGAARGVAAGHG